MGCAFAAGNMADHSSACRVAVSASTWPICDLFAAQVGRNTLIEISPQQFAHTRRVRGGQQIGSYIFGSDRIGFRFLVILALVVAGDRHRKAESNDESQKRQNGGLDDIEVFPLIFANGFAPAPEEVASICREPLG